MRTKTVSARERSDAAVITDSWLRPESFEAIFDRHFDAVHRYLSRRVGSGRADDLASATFVVAFERRRTFQEVSTSARPWLFGIATNLLRNERRTEQRALRALSEVMTQARQTATAASDAETPDLAALLAGLDADQRDVLVLYAWEELSYREIATALGIPVGTVRSRLARARARLRAGLDADSTEPSRASDREKVTE